MTTQDILLRNRINASRQDLQKQLDTLASMIKAIDVPGDRMAAIRVQRVLKGVSAQLQVAEEITQELGDEYRELEDRGCPADPASEMLAVRISTLIGVSRYSEIIQGVTPSSVPGQVIVNYLLPNGTGCYVLIDGEKFLRLIKDDRRSVMSTIDVLEAQQDDGR